MRRTEQRQGLRKFEEVYGRTHRGMLSQDEAALGVSERTFRRRRDRYEAEGAHHKPARVATVFDSRSQTSPSCTVTIRVPGQARAISWATSISQRALSS